MLNSKAVQAIKNRRSIIFHDTMYAKDAISDIVTIARKRYKVFGEKGISDTFFNMSKQERDKFDDMLVFSRHPLAEQASTQEYRFKTYIKEKGPIGDSDPRGYKVNDQIIKGFMIYKSGKPNMFTAKNESGEQYEGTMEEIKKKIDAYWVKQDEAVMKQKVNDEGKVEIVEANGLWEVRMNEKLVVSATTKEGAIKEAKKFGLMNWNDSKTKDVMKQKVRDAKTQNFIQLEKMIGEKLAFKLLEVANEARYAASLGKKYPFEKMFKAKAANAGFSESAINFYLHHMKDSKTKDGYEFVTKYKGWEIYNNERSVTFPFIAYDANKNVIQGLNLIEIGDEIDRRSKTKDEARDIKTLKRYLQAWYNNYSRELKSPNPDKEEIALYKKAIMRLEDEIEELEKNKTKDQKVNDSKTKDAIFWPAALVKVQGQKKNISKPVVAVSKEQAKELLKSIIMKIDSSTEILEITCDEESRDSKTKDEEEVYRGLGYSFIKEGNNLLVKKGGKTVYINKGSSETDIQHCITLIKERIIDKDSSTKDKSPRWRIKDDKMFKLRTATKKMKDAASPALFDNDFEGWKAKAEGLGYEVKENKTTGLWEAKAGIAIKGTYNKTKGGRLYLDSKANDDIMYQGQSYPVKELHRILANKGKVKEFSQLSEKEQKERMDNPFALYESGDNIYAVVRRNKVN